jgi:hypothetical protein
MNFVKSDAERESEERGWKQITAAQSSVNDRTSVTMGSRMVVLIVLVDNLGMSIFALNI